MPELDVEQDEERAEAVHAAVRAATPVVDVVRPWGKEEAKRIIEMVLDEYIGEFNRALSVSTNRLYGLEARQFTANYDALWQAKLGLWRS
jgi:hypothetical protein